MVTEFATGLVLLVSARWISPWLLNRANWLVPLLILGWLTMSGLLIGVGWHFARNSGWWHEGGPTPALVFVGAGAMLILCTLLPWFRYRRYLRELGEKSGHYYEFDGHPLHGVVDEYGALWFYADEIADILGKAPQDQRRMLIGMRDIDCQPSDDPKRFLLSQTGVERLLEKRSGRYINRIANFLLREVYPVHNKRREMGKLVIH